MMSIIASSLITSKKGTPYTPPETTFKGTGFGGSSSIRFLTQTDSDTYVQVDDLVLGADLTTYNLKDYNSTVFEYVQNKLANSLYVVIWVSHGWQESWFSVDTIQNIINAGKIPVFNYWYFGDTLNGNSMPTASEISDYLDDCSRLSNFLLNFIGTYYLILEPEWNKISVTDNQSAMEELTSILNDALDTFQTTLPNTTEYSIAMMDTGRRNNEYTTLDTYSWSKVNYLYTTLSSKLDFISFSQMLGQFSRDPTNPGGWTTPNPTTYTKEELGVDYLGERISNMVQYLNTTYSKKVFIPYIMLASGVWTDTNSNNAIDTNEIEYDGWADSIDKVYKDLYSLRATLNSNKCIGYCTMALFDNPIQDLGGYQYFMNNEYHYGLIGSSAVDESGPATGDIRLKYPTIIDYIFKQ